MNHQDESSSTLIPGIAGYNYADLHKPEKLAEIYAEFEHTVKLKMQRYTPNSPSIAIPRMTL